MNKIQLAYDLIIGKFAVLSLVLLAGLTTAQASDLHTPAEPETLETTIRQIMEDNKIPGLQGVVVTNDGIIWEGHLGVADVQTREAVTPSTLFRVGSITKSITALAVLKAVEEGKISLDMNIETELPEAGVTNRWSANSPILLKHVLEHTAGFDDIHPRDTYSTPEATLREAIDYNKGSRAARWQPGTRMAYSNIGTAIGALALEKATGENFEQFAQREIFDALGMTTATFRYDPAISKSYSPSGEEIPFVHIGLRPSGSASFTTDDMAAFVQMFLNRGAAQDKVLLSPQSITRMETPTSTLSAKKGMKAGYGLANFLFQKNGFIFHGHTGGIDGFLAAYAYLPAHNLGYFFSMNSNNAKAFEEISAVFQAYVTKDLQAGEKPAPVPLGSKEIKAVSGFYKPVSPRTQILSGIELFTNMIRVEATESRMTLSPLLQQGTGQELLSVGNHQYRQKDDVLPTVMFHETDDGTQYLQAAMGTYEKAGLASVLLLWGSAVAVILLTLTSWGYALFWGFKLLRKRFDYRRDILVRALPFLTTLFIPLCLISFIAAMSNFTRLHMPTTAAICFWIGTLAFAIMAALSTVYVGLKWNKRAQIGRLAWLHSMLVALAMSLTVVYFSYHGLIGLRLWDY
jgi:CubicO group peptidase (beta-lactamase class C family)